MLTTKEAADQLGTTQAHIRRLIKKGVLSGLEQDNGYWKVDAAAVARYQRNRRSVGRPLGAISNEPARNKFGEGTERAEQEREYQREYMREYRRGLRRRA